MITETRTIAAVATEVKQLWKNVYFGAKPYLDAMTTLKDKNSTYGQDSATSIVLYFLSNATTFKGEDAKRIKLELKKIIK
jgi:hypothetical protein